MSRKECASEMYERLHGRHGMPDRRRALDDELDRLYRAGRASIRFLTLPLTEAPRWGP